MLIQIENSVTFSQNKEVKMPRLARVKIDGEVFYHLCARTAGPKGDYPLNNKLCRRRLIDLVKRFSRVFCCRILGFSVLGNHYHLLVRFEGRRPITRDELRKRALILYSKKTLDCWLKAKWERFEERIFDVSELMRSLQSSFAVWYNQTFQRRGRFWADRFKSTILEDEEQMLDCLLYIDLNPVRAGLVERPEEYEGSSVYYRELGQDRWMATLTEITGVKPRKTALRDYKAQLYYRGTEASKENQVLIPQHIVKAEEARGFAERGVYLKKWRHFVDGVVIGSEAYVRQHIEQLRAQGQYLRRRNPIRQLGDQQTYLRAQRIVVAEF